MVPGIYYLYPYYPRKNYYIILLICYYLLLNEYKIFSGRRL